ncbi:DUF3105 domain-containing protein [Nocardiopsis aegyptia]|uniref:DUF3105 domain-containing protein n=1 Tax=Nocardiopsis aegyptia TaxID=220378 RepID=UPI00366E0D7F
MTSPQEPHPQGPHGPQQAGPYGGPHGPAQGGPAPGAPYGGAPAGGTPPGPNTPGAGGPYGGPPQGPHGYYAPPPAPAKKGGGGVIAAVIGGVVLLLLLVVGGVVAFVMTRSDGGGGALAGGEIEGVRFFGELPREHVEEGETVDYDGNLPPVGGEHYPIWQDCGVYDEPLRAEYAVHSLEHGAVWIGYDPSLPESDVQALAALYSPGDYLLISPMEGVETPVVASAWGVQLPLDGVDDPRLPRFLAEYTQGERTPEPGAACSGGRSDAS